MSDERLLKMTDTIYNLVDEVDDPSLAQKGKQEVIVIDGRGYDRVLRPDDNIYNLYDVFEASQAPSRTEGAMDEDIRKIALETAEKIARELIPDIAERIIREEIEKLKNVQA